MRTWNGVVVFGALVLAGCAPEVVLPGPFVDVQVTEMGVCALDAAGHVSCFGESARAPSEALTRFALSEHTGCGLRPEGTLLCWRGQWGHEDDAVLQPPAGTYVEVDVGEDFACALDEAGDVVCWGGALDEAGAAQVAAVNADADGELHGLSVGLRHGCVLDDKEQLHCWGATEEARALAFLDKVPEGSFRQVDVGADRACGVTRGGQAACWGAPMELRHEPELTIVPQREPDPEALRQAIGRHTAPPTSDVVAVSVWEDHACALRENTTVRCWGQDHLGQSAAPPLMRFETVRVGQESTCGLLPDGSLMCWGRVAFFVDEANAE